MAFTWLTWDRVQSVSKCMTRQAGEQRPVHTMHVCTHTYLHAHTRMYIQIKSASPLLPVNQNFAVYKDTASLHRVDLYLLLLFIICYLFEIGSHSPGWFKHPYIAQADL